MPGEKGAWRFDKRTYGYLPPPRNLQPPPDNVDNNLVSLVRQIKKECSNDLSLGTIYRSTGTYSKIIKMEVIFFVVSL